MRSTLLPFAALAASFALVAAVAGGCAASADAAFLAERKGAADDRIPEGTTVGTTDSGANSLLPPYGGSPLCRVTPQTCMPDDDGTRPYHGVEPCALRSYDDDGGAADAGALDATAQGCRVGSLGPHCDGADRRGGDGTVCEAGADCAPGFDCVRGDRGGVCRRYCCSASCSEVTAQNGGPTFCDVQTLVRDDAVRVPVCMPLKKCKLLVGSECTEKETCAVVDEKGSTGCVPQGKRDVDQPCDEENCKAGLTCLGTAGDRRCYKLCRTDRTDCGPGQSCKTGALFEDTAIGVCQ